ncbi:MAG: DUF1549 domain-containing protein [Verrucomicrobiales bacterium]|nr:DUF1549 domain-containing protein [Verrucomicrobiales bacterium]
MKKQLFYIITTLCFCYSATIPLQARTWTSTDGKQMQAIFLGIEGENFKFRMRDGQEIVVPSSRFKKADREAAERLERIGDDSFTLASAKKIDNLLATTLVKNGYKSFNKPLPDDLFVRRVYLDIIGRIPTREEFMEFALNPRQDKRQALIDDLLLHPGYASHLFNYFADMYRLHDDTYDRGIRMEPYTQWWREQLQANTPYHKMVSDMLLANGNLGHNPASGFILRDTGMEFDAFANFGQVMLGMDVSCAQCHDHPFNDDLQQMDFYRMAAFFGNTQRTIAYSTKTDESMMLNYKGLPTQMPNAPPGWKNQFLTFAETQKNINLKDQRSNWFKYYLEALAWNVADNENMTTKLPADFLGKGGKPGEEVEPRTLIKPAAKMGGKTRREALRDWMIAPDNPRFALVIANRMWGRAFGKAMIEPVNDFSDDEIRNSAQPQTLAFITSEMRRVNYDLREFMRILYNTRAYQSMATEEEPSFTRKYYFPGPVLRRMRAEQAWDSLMLLSNGREIDTKEGRDGSFYKALLNVDFNTITNEELWQRYEIWNNYRGRRMAAAVAPEGDINSPDVRNESDLRASALAQPAEPASLLDTFGQSDRIITDQHNFDGSVPQVLALMNGSITNNMTGNYSKIVEDLKVLDGPDDKIRGTFFTILSRYPVDDEIAIGREMMNAYGEEEGISDLAWALMNSPEFLFIQ